MRRIRPRSCRTFKPRERCRIPCWRAGFICRRTGIVPCGRRSVSRVRCGSAGGPCPPRESGPPRGTQRGLHSLVNRSRIVLIRRRAGF